MVTKNCSRADCGQENPQTADKFGKNARVKSGLKSECKACCRKYMQNRYFSDPDKAKGASRKWRDANYEKVRLRRAPHSRFKKNQCESCGFSAIDPCQLDIDHIDGDHKNNDPSNLQTLCANCHRLKTKINRDNLSRYKMTVV